MPARKKANQGKPIRKRKAPSRSLTAQVTALREQLSELQQELRSSRAGSGRKVSPRQLKDGHDSAAAVEHLHRSSPSHFEDSAPVYELKSLIPVAFSQLQSVAHEGTSEVGAAPLLIPGILDRARIQWITGKWEALAATDDHQLENHPDRAPLALLVSTARCRMGNLSGGRQLLAKALEWGCPREAAARLLWASTHRTLACAHAVNRREDRSSEHLRLASIIAGETALVPQEEPSGYSRGSARAGRRRMPALTHRAVVIVAGMRHSGSTALFNILRLGLSRAGHDFVSCYSEQENCASKVRQAGRMGLIKTHEFRDDLLAMADFVFTARRDLRDSVASAVRRDFHLYKQLRTPVEYAKYNRTLYDIWAPHSDFEFVYEKFLADPAAVTGNVLEATGLTPSWAPEICQEVLNLPTDDYQTTLLSPQHITDPTHKLTYRDTLASADISAIQTHHCDWLQRHGYAIKKEGK